MKINREKLLEGADVSDVELDADDSVKDMASQIQDAAEEDGIQISIKSAEETAKEIKDAAKDYEADEVVVAPKPYYYSGSPISKVLDRVYEQNMYQFELVRKGYRKHAEPFNVLISGLPGGGKTSIVETWAKLNGLKLVAFNANDASLDKALNGVPTIEKQEIYDQLSDNKKLTPTQLKTIFDETVLEPLMDPKNKEKCIVFVDEFNRQKDTSMRRVFMSFFNEKRNATGSRSFSDNILFSVIAINPHVKGDEGATKLTQAELTRFTDRRFGMNSDRQSTIDYKDAETANTFTDMGMTPPDFLTKRLKMFNGVDPTVTIRDHSDEEILYRQAKMADLTRKILSNPKFKFTDDEDAMTLKYALGAPEVMINSRDLNRAIEYTDGDKKDFIRYVKSSGWSQSVKDAILDTLNGYTFDPKPYGVKVPDGETVDSSVSKDSNQPSTDDGGMTSDSGAEKSDSEVQDILDGLAF